MIAGLIDSEFLNTTHCQYILNNSFLPLLIISDVDKSPLSHDNNAHQYSPIRHCCRPQVPISPINVILAAARNFPSSPSMSSIQLPPPALRYVPPMFVYTKSTMVPWSVVGVILRRPSCSSTSCRPHDSTCQQGPPLPRVASQVYKIDYGMFPSSSAHLVLSDGPQEKGCLSKSPYRWPLHAS